MNASSGPDEAFVVGNAFAFVDLKYGGDGDKSGSAPYTVTFYDAASGRKTATVDVPLWDLKAPQVGDFGGTPAIFLHGVETKGSDGLSAPTTIEHEIGFDASGRKVVDETWNTDEGRVPLLGWTATTADAGHDTRPGLTVYASDGRPRLKLPSDHGAFGDVQPVLVTVVNDIALVQRARASDRGTERYLAAYDLTHPAAPLWTSNSARPKDAAGLDPTIAFVSGSKIGLVWPAGSGRVIVAVQDARTGALTGATPAIDEYPGIRGNTPIEEADNARSGAAVLALAHASSGIGSVAVSLTDGHLLWQQTGDQEGFDPQVVVGSTAYGTSGASPGNGARPSLAVSLATGQVQAKSLTTAPIAATDTGYAIVPEVGDDGANGSYWIFQARNG